jgi:hypothetical protein
MTCLLAVWAVALHVDVDGDASYLVAIRFAEISAINGE